MYKSQRERTLNKGKTHLQETPVAGAARVRRRRPSRLPREPRRDRRVDGERPRLGGGALAADLVEHVGVVAAPEVERQRAARGRGREALEQRGRGVAPRHGLVVEADEDVAGPDVEPRRAAADGR